MKSKFAADMALWERGGVSLAVLKDRYPHRDVESITNMYSLMNAAITEPVPDPIAGWNEVRFRMASRRARADQTPVSVLSRLRPGLQRRLAFGLAAAVMAVPPVALAANNLEVRDSVLEIFNIDVGTGGLPVDTSSGDAGQVSGAGEPLGAARPGDGQSVGDVPGGAAGGAATQPKPAQPGAPGPIGSNVVSSGSGGNGSPAARGTDGEGSDSDGADAAAAADGADAPTPTNTATPAVGTEGVASQPGKTAAGG